MIEGLEELKKKIRQSKRDYYWVELGGFDQERMAEWLFELDERVEELERKCQKME